MIQSLGGRVFLGVLTLCAVVLPLMALFAPLGMAPALIILGLSGFWATWGRPWRCLLQGMGPWILTVGGWGMLTVPFAIDPLHSARVAATFVILALLGYSLRQALLALTPVQRRLCLVLWLTATLAAFLLLLADIFSCGRLFAIPINGSGDICVSGRFVYKRGLTALTLMSMPAVAMLARVCTGPLLWATIVAILGIAGGCALWLGSETLTLVLLTVPWLMALAMWRPRFCLLGLRWVMISLVILVPVMATSLPAPGQWREWGEDQVPSSLHHRLTIWHFAGQRFLEKPVIGWGVDSARSIPGGEDRYVLRNKDRVELGLPRAYNEQYMPLHPHNFIVQWFMEMGLVGGALLLWGAWRMVGHMLSETSPNSETALPIVVIAGVVMISLFSFGAWQSWWLSALWIVGAFVAPSPSPTS